MYSTRLTTAERGDEFKSSQQKTDSESNTRHPHDEQFTEAQRGKKEKKKPDDREEELHRTEKASLSGLTETPAVLKI